MSIVLSSPPASKSSRRGRPVFPIRHTPRPVAPFAAGIEPVGPHTPIDQRPLPTIYGAGLTEEETRRVTGARNRARAYYARECPDASDTELERVARLAATDELRRALKDRPAAPPLAIKVTPPVAPVTPAPAPRPHPQPRRMPYTAADLAWAAQELNQDARDYEVVRPARQPVTLEQWLENCDPGPCALLLSDDRTDFLAVSVNVEGGAW